MVANFNRIWNRTESCKIQSYTSAQVKISKDRTEMAFCPFRDLKRQSRIWGDGVGHGTVSTAFAGNWPFFSSAAYGKSYFLCTHGRASCKERLQLHIVLGSLHREREGWISRPHPVVLKRLWQACWLGRGGAERFKPFSLRGNRTQCKIRFKFLFCCWFLSFSEGKKCLQQRICLMQDL